MNRPLIKQPRRLVNQKQYNTSKTQPPNYQQIVTNQETNQIETLLCGTKFLCANLSVSSLLVGETL